MMQSKTIGDRNNLGNLWLLPVTVLLLSFITGGLAKWVFMLPRGHLLWDISLILLSASIFGTAGFVIGWAIFASDKDNEEGE